MFLSFRKNKEPKCISVQIEKKKIKRAAVSFSTMCSSRIFVRWATSKTLTRTPNNLDPQKPGPSKIWTLKNMDSEKHGINMGLKNMSDFRELCFKNTIRNVICCLKVHRYLTTFSG